MNPESQTIAAIATPPGVGGVGIIRLSGDQARAIAETLSGRELKPRHAHFARFSDAEGEVLDEGLVLYFPEPRSYTGETVVELHTHGGPVVMSLVLDRVLALGARRARPGEFSERAFLNDKLDLAQAEAVADLISAGTEAAARAAQRSLAGEFSNRVHALVQALTGLRVFVEAAIDFPDEEVDFLADGQVLEQLDAIDAQLADLAAGAQHGQLLRDGLTLALAGRPNAGKSSLLNALAGADRAIVTAVPGTTRDVLREAIQIDGIPVHVIDTAGLRDSVEPVEREGVRRARAVLAEVDHVLLVHDESGPDESLKLEVPAGTAITEVHNKIDLSGDAPRLDSDAQPPCIWLSARTGQGIDLLRQHLKQVAGVVPGSEGAFSARHRHLEALARAREHLATARRRLVDDQAGELLAEELRLAQGLLGRITGQVSADDLLGEIFSSFCIGK